MLTVPPGSGQITATKIETGGITIEGLSLQASPNTPTPASTAATPKAAASKP
jgi:AsmA protein